MTKCADMEAYWGEQSIIEAHFGVGGEAAADILTEAVNAACAQNRALEKRRTKRNDASQKIPEARRGQLPQFGDADVEAAAPEHGDQHKVLGKDLVSAIRKSAQDRGLPRASSFGKSVPSGFDQVLVDELRQTLEALL